MKITHLKAHQILDSRGVPTIQCELFLEDGSSYHASVPSGASCSAYEAHEKRDGGIDYGGMGVTSVVHTIEHTILSHIKGREPNFITIDSLLCEYDGTDDKSNFGANAILAVSLAAARAQASYENTPLYTLIADVCNFTSLSMPLPLCNMINGGAHANTGVVIQEFLVIPTQFPTFTSALEASVIFYHALQNFLRQDGYSIALGDEGGFAPQGLDVAMIFDYLMRTIDHVQDRYEGVFKLGLDMASSQFYNASNQTYRYRDMLLTATDLIDLYGKWIETYPLIYIEDGMAQSDWKGWHDLTQKMGKNVHIIGDDLFATNPERIWKGIEEDCATGAIIKPNQIGTLTEALQAVQLCREYEKIICVSHRSGETNDDFIADLAVGVSAPFIKAGAPARGERVAKYNRLMAIEEELTFAD